MEKVKTVCGYDIFKLTARECHNKGKAFPTYVVFVEGENYDTAGFPEEEADSLAMACNYCEKYPTRKWEEEINDL